MAEIIRELRRDHRNLSALFDVLERQTGRLADGGEPDYTVIEGILDYCATYADQVHHPKEDLVYARLKQLGGEIAQAGSDLEAEHVEITALTRRAAEAIREVRFGGGVSRARIGGLLREFLSTYRRHMEEEESILFPAALARLAEADWAQADARIGRRDDPLFGAAVERRFTALRDYINTLDRIAEEG